MLGIATAAAQSDFQGLRRELWPLAEARGISRTTFEAAFAGLTPDARVVTLTHRQPEYGKPFGAYVNAMASPARIEAGRRKAAQWADTLGRVERAYGVERWIILALWGIETSYGADRDRWDVIRSLATLVEAGYRAPYFRSELLVALKILQDGHVARKNFLGSWAGAMGQPQFMPSNFYDYAVDFSGDGRRDIWSDVPDVLASIGNYLHKEGWTPGLPWGIEVRLPPGFDLRKSRATFAQWAALGLARADGGTLPAEGDAILFFPSGAHGPAFLVTHNFEVIKLYNNSDVYALAAGHLADRLRGNPPVAASWPADDRQLAREDRVALQKKLAALGYKVRDFEGRFDFDLRDAIRLEQDKLGLLPDGHPTAELLVKLGVPAR